MVLQLSVYVTIPFFYVETAIKSIAFVFMLIIMWKVRGKYLENKQKVALYLYQAMFCFAWAVLAQTFDALFLDDLSLAVFGYFLSFGEIAGYVFSGMANYFLLKFSMGLTEKGSQRTALSVLVVNLTAIAFFALFTIMKQDLVATYFLVIHIIISYTIFGMLSKRAFATARRTPELIYSRGLQLIAWFGICLVLVFGLFVIDAVYQAAMNENTFTIFGSIAWVIGMLGAYAAYVGFCRPAWFVRRYSGKPSPLEKT